MPTAIPPEPNGSIVILGQTIRPDDVARGRPEALSEDAVNAIKSTRSLRIGALVLLMCALIGLGVFGLLAWRAVTIEDATHADAERRIASILSGISSKAPLVEIDDDGRLVRMASAGEATGRARTIWSGGDRRSHES
jgi:hypothetical protein